MRRPLMCLFHLLSLPIHSSGCVSFRYILSAFSFVLDASAFVSLISRLLHPVYLPLQPNSRSSSAHLSSSSPHPFYLLSSCRILTGHVSPVLATTTASIKTSRPGPGPHSFLSRPDPTHPCLGVGGGVDLV